MSQITSIDLIKDLEAESRKYMCLADVLFFLGLRLNCDVSVAAEILLSRIPMEQGVNPSFFGQKIGMATFRQSPNDPLLSGLLEGVIIGADGTFDDIPLAETSLSKKYWDYSFILEGLEKAVSFKLDTLSNELPDYLIPYKSRISIRLTEAANIMAGCKPRDVVNKMPAAEIIGGYMASLWDAVDHDILTGRNEVLDYSYNESNRVDITLVKDEVTEWAKKNDIKWPFELSNHENEDEVILAEDTAQTIQTLMVEKARLKEELSDLKANSPIFLEQYRPDDPLSIAIKLRNAEWSSFNENVRSSIPSAEYLVAKIKSEHDMSDALAKAIEKVACPIQR